MNDPLASGNQTPDDIIDWASVRQLETDAGVVEFDVATIQQRVILRRRQRIVVRGIASCMVLIGCLGGWSWWSTKSELKPVDVAQTDQPLPVEQLPVGQPVETETSIKVRLVEFNRQLDQLDQLLLEQQLLEQRSSYYASCDELDRAYVNRVRQQALVARRLEH